MAMKGPPGASSATQMERACGHPLGRLAAWTGRRWRGACPGCLHGVSVAASSPSTGLPGVMLDFMSRHKTLSSAGVATTSATASSRRCRDSLRQPPASLSADGVRGGRECCRRRGTLGCAVSSGLHPSFCLFTTARHTPAARVARLALAPSPRDEPGLGIQEVSKRVFFALFVSEAGELPNRSRNR